MTVNEPATTITAPRPLTDARRRRLIRKLAESNDQIRAAYEARLDLVLEAKHSGITLREIGDALGMTRDGVKKLLGRARTHP